jgi:hypothetical protein
LPETGATRLRMRSGITSEGTTPPSSLLRAHAPHQTPLAVLVSLYHESLQVATSPCWRMVVPDVISACLSLDAWTPTPAACRVHLPITSPPPSAFPKSLWVGSPRQSAQRLLSGGDFGAAVIPLCSGLEVCCHPGRSYRSVNLHWAAVAFTSEQNTGRYLPVHRIC